MSLLSIELLLTKSFEEKNLVRVSTNFRKEYTFSNCSNERLSCIITEKPSESYVGKLFGSYRDKRKIHGVMFFYEEGHFLYSDIYLCGNEKDKEIKSILDKCENRLNKYWITTKEMRALTFRQLAGRNWFKDYGFHC